MYFIHRSVIGRLRNGLKIDPERYESATISFCDIVSFTKLAADSSPLQVSEIHKIFKCFMSINDLPKLSETIKKAQSFYEWYL